MFNVEYVPEKIKQQFPTYRKQGRLHKRSASGGKFCPQGIKDTILFPYQLNIAVVVNYK